MTGQSSSALYKSFSLSLMTLAELVYTRALTPEFWQASMTAWVPPTLTLRNRSWAVLLSPLATGEAVWMTTSGLILLSISVSLAASVMSHSWYEARSLMLRVQRRSTEATAEQFHEDSAWLTMWWPRKPLPPMTRTLPRSPLFSLAIAARGG
ncbi:hypothetical protein MKX07_001827 [Trichoderma sp. CBMAI-0711]|nr:hypothetical protein MKX07_001827 [Trichoderma sp. CBMAI-0711]